jgi:putative membrane protein
LGQSLRGLNPLDNIGHLISPEEMDTISKHNNKPLALLYLHGKDIQRLRAGDHLEPLSQVQLDNTLVRLCDAQGRSERIKTTVFPVTYRLFLHCIVYLFIVTLSIA